MLRLHKRSIRKLVYRSRSGGLESTVNTSVGLGKFPIVRSSISEKRCSLEFVAGHQALAECKELFTYRSNGNNEIASSS
jgi:hypothetical protein